ncbi:hypothetical protein BER93_16435 [Xanthomonas fragariae]|nr:hypothetical protein BER92_16385 [Xanthomonas fragariae]AOD19404.1 hypothetical protein BER93_16435 [Xanthomonas fragariae]
MRSASASVTSLKTADAHLHGGAASDLRRPGQTGSRRSALRSVRDGGIHRWEQVRTLNAVLRRRLFDIEYRHAQVAVVVQRQCHHLLQACIDQHLPLVQGALLSALPVSPTTLGTGASGAHNAAPC